MSKSVTDGELAFNARLGSWLKQLRLNNKLSQTELSERLGVHRNTLARYEAGTTLPLYVFLRICKVLDRPPAEVLKW